MFYSIRHSTRFRYSEPVRQSIMEVMMQPRSEGNQTVRQFDLTTTPRARIFARRDFLGNVVHHFDIPGAHDQLSVVAEALVEVGNAPLLPDALDANVWQVLDNLVQDGDFWDYLMPSKFVRPSEPLHAFARDHSIARRVDPLSFVRQLNETIYNAFTYVPQYTRADSPIEEALEARKGVCQDFTHIMLTLLREVGIPARYVSGYLYHRTDSADRSVADATHAWAEVMLPGLGWVGFDPTNNLVCGERHIRTAVGRDYGDVPPTHGIYRGRTRAELRVAVHVTPADAPRPEELEPIGTSNWMSYAGNSLNMADDMEEIVQQQQ